MLFVLHDQYPHHYRLEQSYPSADAWSTAPLKILMESNADPILSPPDYPVRDGMADQIDTEES